MKKMWIIVGIFALAMTLACMASAQKETQKAAPPADKAAVTPAGSSDIGAVIKQKCVACHGMKKICNEVGKTDQAEWEKIVNRMAVKALKKNITVTDDEKKGMIQYLTSLKDSKPLCD